MEEKIAYAGAECKTLEIAARNSCRCKNCTEKLDFQRLKFNMNEFCQSPAQEWHRKKSKGVIFHLRGKKYLQHYG